MYAFHQILQSRISWNYQIYNIQEPKRHSTVTYANDVVTHSPRSRRRSHIHRTFSFCSSTNLVPIADQGSSSQSVHSIFSWSLPSQLPSGGSISNQYHSQHSQSRSFNTSHCIHSHISTVVHPEIPFPRVTDLREDIALCMMQWYARFIKINLRHPGVDVDKFPEGRSHFLSGILYEGERMIEWLEAQGYLILENAFMDCNHYLTHDKGYEILNIYDNKLPQIQAYQDSCQLDIPPTRVCTKMYHSKNGLFLSMFPWIKDTDFHPIIRDGIDDGSLNFQTESIARDRLHRWIRRDQRVDVPIIHQWNTAFDRYMRNKFH